MRKNLDVLQKIKHFSGKNWLQMQNFVLLVIVPKIIQSINCSKNNIGEQKKSIKIIFLNIPSHTFDKFINFSDFLKFFLIFSWHLIMIYLQSIFLKKMEKILPHFFFWTEVSQEILSSYKNTDTFFKNVYSFSLIVPVIFYF